VSSKPAGEHLLETLAVMVGDDAMKILGVDQALAELLGDEIATRFSSQFGGELTYIPKGRVFRTSKLHRRIWEEFTGHNHTELARRHQVSVIHIYRIVARERERDRAERQAQLPGV
jgi:Mor family transcriptional regulator